MPDPGALEGGPIGAGGAKLGRLDMTGSNCPGALPNDLGRAEGASGEGA